MLKNDGFKNPEDLFEVMRDLAKNNKATKDVYLNQLNEFDEGLYWIKEGKEVTISKKFGTKNAPSEIDVLLDPEIGIVECKRVIGGERAVHARIKDIIIKFKSPDPSKIKPSLKKTHSKFIGQLKIDGGGEYRNLDKDNFIRKIKESGVLGDSNYFTSDDLKILKELHITNDSKRFIIYNSDW